MLPGMRCLGRTRHDAGLIMQALLSLRALRLPRSDAVLFRTIRFPCDLAFSPGPRGQSVRFRDHLDELARVGVTDFVSDGLHSRAGLSEKPASFGHAARGEP